MKTLVIIPCYNEQDAIINVIENLKQCANDVDYLVINDCSTDNSRQILTDYGANFINNPINLGIGGGMQAGYIYAMRNGYDIAVQMDGDGQHDPKYLKDVIRPIENGECDMSIGSRYITKEGFQSTFMRQLGIKILSFLIKILSGKKIYDVTSGYRAVSRNLIEFFAANYADDYPEPEAIMTSLMNGYRVCEVPVIMVERKTGVSSIRAFKSAYYMVKVCLALVVDRIKTPKKAGKN